MRVWVGVCVCTCARACVCVCVCVTFHYTLLASLPTAESRVFVCRLVRAVGVYVCVGVCVCVCRRQYGLAPPLEPDTDWQEIHTVLMRVYKCVCVGVYVSVCVCVCRCVCRHP